MGRITLFGEKEKTIKEILWVLFYTEPNWADLYFNEKPVTLKQTVVKHFKSVQNIKKLGKLESVDIIIHDKEFKNNARETYIDNLITRYKNLKRTKIVFLDPDNGLASRSVQYKHVTSDNIKKIWRELRQKDWLVLYQHSIRESNWRQHKRKQFACACGCSISDVNQWDAPKIANDVIFFYLEKK
jgi:hypothetical protein